MSSASDTEPAATTAKLRDNRDFLLLWGGQVISVLGSRITTTALPLLVLAVTGSAADAGVVAAAATLPYLALNLVAGTLVDRWPRRLIMLTCQMVASLAVASIVVSLLLGVLTLAQLVVVAFVDGSCLVFFGLAERAAIPRIVSPPLLPAALAQNEARGRSALLAGPPLAGLLYAAGRAVPFVADALSYLVGFVSLLFVRADLQPERSGPRSSLWRATAAGLRWLWRERFIRAVVLLLAVSNMIFQALFLVLIVLVQARGGTSATVGIVLGLFGAGGLVGALAASRLHRPFSPRAVIVGVNWIWALMLPLLALPVHPLVLGIVGALITFIGPLSNVVTGAYVARLVPNELMGRVNSAAMTLSWGLMPLGSLAAGALLETVGTVGAVIGLAAGMLIVAGCATVSPALRRIPELAPRPAEPAAPDRASTPAS